MTPAEYFQPLKDAFMSRDFYHAEIYDLLGGMAQHYIDIAPAMCYHIRDLLTEAANEPNADDERIQWNVLLAETFRRTFYDAETAALYGTEAYVNGTIMQRITDFMVEKLAETDEPAKHPQLYSAAGMN